MNDVDNRAETVECPICGKSFRQLPNHIMKTHNMDMDEFVEKYPGARTSCEGSHVLQASGRDKGSLVQRQLFDYLSDTLGDRVYKEYRLGSMFIDIAVPDVKLAVEVDGTYFHAGEQLRTAQQEQVAIYAERKNKALAELGWTLVRVTDETLVFRPSSFLQTLVKYLPELGGRLEGVDLFPDRRKVCLRCGKSLTLKQFYSDRQFCSQSCRTAYREIHPEMRRCHSCKKSPTSFAWRGYRFCSETCFQQYMDTHAKSSRPCLYCGKPVYVLTTADPADFCDQECMNKFKTEFPEKWTAYRAQLSANSDYNNKRRSAGRVKFTCAVCGKEGWKHARSLRNSASGNMFCSIECYRVYRKGLKTRKGTER